MKILILLSAILLVACSRPEGSTRALKQAGYTNITIEGMAFFGCSESDSFNTKFTATGPRGHSVKGVVCSGLMKGFTIRLF